jgi:hypothetical protein
VTEGEPEDVELTLGEKELLTEGHFEGVCEVQRVALVLWVPLPLPVPEGKGEGVPG